MLLPFFYTSLRFLCNFEEKLLKNHKLTGLRQKFPIKFLTNNAKFLLYTYLSIRLFTLLIIARKMLKLIIKYSLCNHLKRLFLIFSKKGFFFWVITHFQFFFKIFLLIWRVNLRKRKREKNYNLFSYRRITYSLRQNISAKTCSDSNLIQI